MLSALLASLIAAPAAPSIPFPEALADADVGVEGLNSILDDSLLLGNGDLNGLVWTEQGTLMLQVTKNDVWDARLDTTNDPPLPTLRRIRELGRAGGPIRDPILPEGAEWTGPDSYHSKPYPCPRVCAQVAFGELPAGPRWHPIRAEGRVNTWERRGEVAVMSIEGRANASNGFSFRPLGLDSGDYDKLRLRLSGSENARYFVDIIGPDGASALHTGWQDTPVEPEDIEFALAADAPMDRLILYTWTVDGQPAENRFESVVFEGPAGTLPVDLELPTPPTSSAHLDLTRAVATVAGAEDAIPSADIRALAGRNVFLIRSSAPATLMPVTTIDTPEATLGETGGVEWLHQEIPGDLDWPGMSYAVALAQGSEWKAVSVVTSLEARDVVRAAARLARRTLRAEPEELIRRHDAEWERFWSKSGVTLDDEVLQRTWYRSLYFLRCVTKPGVVPPGLFMSLTTTTPAWHGDYHTNYNEQQSFWAAYPTNHPELAEPYDRLIAGYVPRARWLAREVFDMEGAFFPHVLFAYEPLDPELCVNPIGRQYFHHTWAMTLGVTGFTVQPLWWHYKYAPSRELLEDIYPAVRETAVFYAEFLEYCTRREGGRFGPTVSPEHWGWTPGLSRNYNCASDIGFARYALEAAIEAARTLGHDEEFPARCEAALELLPEYPLSGGDEPVVVDVEGAPPITYNISVPANPVFPCDVVTWQSPEEEQALFRRTIEGLQWNGNNAMVMMAIARARLGMEDAQQWLREETLARTRPNGTVTLNRLGHGINTYGHYTEQTGCAMAVCELLVQSVGDVLRIAPALDASCNAEFRDLRTQGGFLVSGAVADGAVLWLDVRSTTGGTLRLVDPWGDGEVTQRITKPGRIYRFRPPD